MMFRLSILYFLLLGLCGCSFTDHQKLSVDIRPSDLDRHIQVLADPSMEGRLAGTLQEAGAANYITDHFRQFGLEPGGERDTYLQFFTLSGSLPQAMSVDGHLSRNIIGILPGTQRMDEFLIIGAHYDSQGMGGVISLNDHPDSVIHPGADDNASGTAGLLELAHYFSFHRPERTLVFIGFSGEELGLIGSRHFMRNSTLPEGNVIAMINLDMIGRMEENELTIAGTGSSAYWPEILRQAGEDSLEIRQVRGDSGISDHVPFYESNIPVLHYYTGSHSDYHRPEDTADKINAEGTARIVRHVQRVVATLDTVSAERLSFNAQP